MEIKVNVIIDLSPMVKTLLLCLMGAKTDSASEQSTSVKTIPKSKINKPIDTQAVSEHDEPSEIATVQTPVEETPASHAKSESADITDVELRREIKECRERIMQGKTDPLLKAQINAKLREKVSQMGFDSSTKLPQNMRREFIDFCKNLNIENDDELPF